MESVLCDCSALDFIAFLQCIFTAQRQYEIAPRSSTKLKQQKLNDLMWTPSRWNFCQIMSLIVSPWSVSAVRKSSQEDQSNTRYHVNPLSHLAQTESEITSQIFYTVFAVFFPLLCVCFSISCVFAFAMTVFLSVLQVRPDVIIILRCVMTEGRRHLKDEKKHTQIIPGCRCNRKHGLTEKYG